MKTITTILLSLLTLISYSQTKLDLEVFKIINEYRVSNGLKKLIWSTEAFVVTETHNNYMVKAGKLCHGEPIDVPNHREVDDLGERFRDKGISYSYVGENVACVLYSDSLLPYISRSIVNNWINSKYHNEFLLDTNIKFCSISTSLVGRKKLTYSDITGHCFTTFNAFK